jgi:hypothetical protein
MQTMNPRGVVASEVDGLWQKDSQSFYSSKEVKDARTHTITIITKRAYDDEIFVAGYDSARGGSDDRSASGKADDFAITTLRVSDKVPTHVSTVRANNVTAEQMAALVYDQYAKFQHSFVGYDPGGGGLFVRDELRKSCLHIGDKLVPITPIVEPTDNTGVIGTPILIPFKRGFVFTDQIWGKMPSDSILVNRLHREASGAISTGNMMLAPEWAGWDEVGSAWDVDAKREWLNTLPALSPEQRQLAEMDLAVSQLIMIDIERDKDSGKPKIDKYGMFKFGSKSKKDSAYSLIYAYYTYLIWNWIVSAGLEAGVIGDEPAVTYGEC